jgi:predicted nuclease of restriction endonuclease-like RecB superfamily
MENAKSLQESLDELKLSLNQIEDELYADLTDEEIIELFNLDEEPIKLNLSKEERARLKSGLDIFTFMQAETADTEETVICPCRVILDKAKRDPKYDADETVEHCIEFPGLIEFGSKYYSEVHMLNDEFVKINKNELIKIKEFYDKFKFPETPKGLNDENHFFDELSELYLSPTEDESQELISKYHKYYNPTFK